MTSASEVPEELEGPEELATRSESQRALVEKTRSYARAAKSPATTKAYASDWRGFQEWCTAKELEALPASPATVALYIASLAARGRKVSTITRGLTALSQVHQLAGHPSPTWEPHVREVLKGVRRIHGVAPRQKAPIDVDTLKEMVGGLDAGDLRGMRDRTLLLLGFSGAFRRAELVGLDVEDIVFVKHGLEVTIRRSKTDQDGEGHKIGVLAGLNAETCPSRALRAWLAAGGVSTGPVFRAVGRRRQGTSSARLSEKVVADVVKAAAARVGLDASSFAGHSLRAGFITSAAKAGRAERSIMAISRHRSTEMLRRYIRDVGLFEDHAASGIGL